MARATAGLRNGAVIVGVLLSACTGASPPASGHYDVIIRGGTIYDGGGGDGFVGDVGIAGDSIHAVGDLSDASADQIIDAQGLAVAPRVHQHAELG